MSAALVLRLVSFQMEPARGTRSPTKKLTCPSKGPLGISKRLNLHNQRHRLCRDELINCWTWGLMTPMRTQSLWGPTGVSGQQAGRTRRWCGEGETEGEGSSAGAIPTYRPMRPRLWPRLNTRTTLRLGPAGIREANLLQSTEGPRTGLKHRAQWIHIRTSAGAAHTRSFSLKW